MKTVIIGGGIAGLTLGVYLQRQGMEVVVNERALGTPGGGHAFLMHHDGLEVLNELVAGTTATLPGQLVQQFILRRPDGRCVQDLSLGAWHCMKRTALSTFLYTLLGGKLKDGRSFSHFLYEGDKAVAAVFENGAVEYGDIFVGADGGFSRVRKAIFGEMEFKPGGVKEVVGIAHVPELAAAQAGVFNKYQKEQHGLAFGMIPTSATEVVWFIQYNPAISEPASPDAESLRAFCAYLLKDFPPTVQHVLQGNDFAQTYLWNTRDFDLLPAFHKNNVVLMGDAAHLALPFTSAGTTNALLDARTLAQLLREIKEPADCEQAFATFYAQRSAPLLKHLDFGRKMRDAFLDPRARQDDSLAVPLI